MCRPPQSIQRIIRSAWILWLATLAMQANAQLPGQGVIEETDRRLFDYFNDQGCLRGSDCAGNPGAGSSIHYGALYLSQDKTRYGVGWDFADEQSAHDAAKTQCGADCRPALEHQSGCLAVARPSNASSVHFALSDHGVEARILAKGQCRDAGHAHCQAEVQICMGRVNSPGYITDIPLNAIPPDSVLRSNDDIAYLLSRGGNVGVQRSTEDAAQCLRSGNPRCLLMVMGLMARNFHRFNEVHPALDRHGMGLPGTVQAFWEQQFGARYPGLADTGRAAYELHRGYWQDLRCDLSGAYARLDGVRADLGDEQHRALLGYALEGLERFIYDRCLRPGHPGLKADQWGGIQPLDDPGPAIPSLVNIPHEDFLSAERFAKQARRAYQDGRLADADTAMSQALGKNPSDAGYYGERCVIRKELGRYRAALDDCGIALGLDANDVDSLIQRADILGKMGRHREAARQLDTLFPLRATAHRHMLRGWHRIKAGDVEQGLWDCQQSLALEPNDVNTLTTRALAYFLLGEEQAARADLESAERLLPGQLSADALWQRFEAGNY